MEWIQGAAASVMSAIGFEDIVQDTKKDDDKAQPASIAQTSASVATTPQGAMMTKVHPPLLAGVAGIRMRSSPK